MQFVSNRCKDLGKKIFWGYRHFNLTNKHFLHAEILLQGFCLFSSIYSELHNYSYLANSRGFSIACTTTCILIQVETLMLGIFASVILA